MATPVSSVIDGKKTCSSCGLLKALGEFSTHPTGLGGRRSRCRVCVSARMATWRQNNPERVLEEKRTYWARHGERLNTRRRDNRDDAVRARERAWRHAHPEKARAMNHRRRVQARSTDPVIVARIAVLLTMPCAYCGALEHIEIDHVIPLARGGRHEASNLAAACRRCNRSKKDRLLSEWKAAA